MPAPTLTLFTPTYHVDLPRFAFLRESLERCGVDLPHVAVVHDEDLSRFRDLPHQRNLTLVSTRDVLGRKMERRRRARPHRRRHPMHWLGPAPLHGWMSQQLIKLAAPRVVDTPAYVCLDSDTVCLRRFTAEDFFEPDGRLHLYETQDDMDAEMGGWTFEAMRFLKLPLREAPLYRYTHVPVPMRVETVRGLVRRIESVRGPDWMDAFDHAHVTEYAAYGGFARYGSGLEGLAPVAPPLSAYLWWPHEIAAIPEAFRCRVGDPRRKLVVMQSKRAEHVDQLRGLVQAFWRDAASGGGVNPAEELTPIG